MKRLGYVIAALGALIIAAPSIADAQTVVIKRGGHHAGQHHHHHGARATTGRIATVAGIVDIVTVIATGSWSSRGIATEADTSN